MKQIFLYSVTQSMCNSLLVDVVLNSFNTIYRDEDSILDQTYQNKYVFIFTMMNLNLHNILRKYIITLRSTKTQFYEFLVAESCISLYMHFLQSLLKIKIFKIVGRKYLLFIYLVLNTAFIPIYHVKAVQDDIS